MAQLPITSQLSIDDAEINWHFIRASGPGGQKVNKVATAAQLRFNIAQSSLPDDIKQRLRQLTGNRVNQADELVITAKRFRTQLQNRRDALQRLLHFIEIASHPPKPLRRKTRIPKAIHEKRLKNKRHRSERKRQRQKPGM